MAYSESGVSHDISFMKMVPLCTSVYVLHICVYNKTLVWCDLHTSFSVFLGCATFEGRLPLEVTRFSQISLCFEGVMATPNLSCSDTYAFSCLCYIIRIWVVSYRPSVLKVLLGSYTPAQTLVPGQTFVLFTAYPFLRFTCAFSQLKYVSSQSFL